MLPDRPPACLSCERFHGDEPPTCSSFPAGIPDIVFDALVSHRVSFHGEPTFLGTLPAVWDEPVDYGTEAMGDVQKGDFDGHPFRGNQWTDGQGGGTADVHDVGREMVEQGSGTGMPTLNDLGRSIVGAPKDMNTDPSKFQAIPFGKTQHGEKLEAAIKKEEAKLANGLVLKGGAGAPDIKISTTPQEMSDRLETLFNNATPDEMAHKDWYAKEAGGVVNELHAFYKDKIPGLGKDTVAGILAACSANNLWDDKWGTKDQVGTSNQVVAQRILEAWTANARHEVTPESLALAKAYLDKAGIWSDMRLPKVGTHSFQDLARTDPRSAFLFNTPWKGGGKYGKGEGEGFGFGGMPGHVIPSLGLLTGKKPEDVYGKESKVRSFYSNIATAISGQEDHNATLDIWMGRAMLGNDSITGNHYGSFVGNPSRYEMYRRILDANAKKHGLEPKQYQAVTWYALRNRFNSDPAVKQMRDDAKAAKRAAGGKKPRVKKAFDPTVEEPDDGPSIEDENGLAWLARAIAHESGADVDSDPLFGPWDDDDEAAVASLLNDAGPVVS